MIPVTKHVEMVPVTRHVEVIPVTRHVEMIPVTRHVEIRLCYTEGRRMPTTPATACQLV
jgi:hypothetical protein